jgi:hypothetical protein
VVNCEARGFAAKLADWRPNPLFRGQIRGFAASSRPDYPPSCADSSECQVIVFPQFPSCKQLPSAKSISPVVVKHDQKSRKTLRLAAKAEWFHPVWWFDIGDQQPVKLAGCTFQEFVLAWMFPAFCR